MRTHASHLPRVGSEPSSSQGTDTYQIVAQTTLTGITGIRLEAMPDSSLPTDGPGRFPSNGNFVLSEFGVSVTAVPEPSTYALMLAGLGFVGFVANRRRKARFAA